MGLWGLYTKLSGGSLRTGKPSGKKSISAQTFFDFSVYNIM